MSTAFRIFNTENILIFPIRIFDQSRQFQSKLAHDNELSFIKKYILAVGMCRVLCTLRSPFFSRLKWIRALCHCMRSFFSLSPSDWPASYTKSLPTEIASTTAAIIQQFNKPATGCNCFSFYYPLTFARAFNVRKTYKNS